MLPIPTKMKGKKVRNINFFRLKAQEHILSLRGQILEQSEQYALLLPRMKSDGAGVFDVGGGDLRAYAEQQKELGRFPRPLNNRLSDVIEWMESQQVVAGAVLLQQLL